MAERPSRDDAVTTPCGVCGRAFVPSGRRRFCSAACRQAAWRRRHARPLPALPARRSPPATVYECGECGARYLGQQRCDACHRFCRRIGPGGLCPHCDEPVAVADLLPTTDRGGGDGRLRPARPAP